MGLGMRNLFVVQGVKKLSTYIEEKGRQSITGSLIRGNFKAALIHVGVGEEGLFNLNYNIFSIMLSRI